MSRNCHQIKMAFFTLCCFLIFSRVHIVFTTSAELTSEESADDEEIVLKFTQRTFSNPGGKWITQVHMEREGFAEEGEVPHVKFSVEQNKTESSRPPRLVSQISESFHPEIEVLQFEDSRFQILGRYYVGWYTAQLMCRMSHKNLALPSDAAIQWIRSQPEDISFKFLENTGVHVGINNLESSDTTLETVLGQPITNGSEILKGEELLCTAWNMFENPPKLTFGDCMEKRPFFCETPQKWVPKTFDASPWLGPDTQSFLEGKD